MTRWVSDGAAHPRRALFFRAQAPFVVVVVVLVVLGFTLGLTSHRNVWTGIAGGVIVLASVLALAVPWERMPSRATVVLPVLNLFAVAALSIEFHASIPTLPALAIFPAVWLATDHGGPGTVLGVVGGFAASVLPVAVMSEASSDAQWLSTLVIPVLVATAVVTASMMTRRTEKTRATLVDALRERDTAAAETARLGAALQSFARQVDVGIVIFDTAGTVMISNDAAAMFGDVARYDAQDGAGRYVYREDQVTRLPSEEQPLNRVLAGEVVQDLLVWVGPRGDQRALLANGAPVTSPTGSAAGSFLVLHDLTDVIHASRERESALATLTHELRTPLTAIIGYLDMIELDELPAEAQKVAIATRNAEHMLALTSAFLNGLRPAVGLELRSAAPAAIIREAVAAAQALPGADDRPFEVTCEAEGLVSRLDPDGIRQVMDNLLSNAVKFSEPGSTIRISSQVDEEAGMFCVVVANRGERLDDDELERIFDRFHRGSNARSQAVPGAGLGLTISRDIARRHGGSLAASRDDEGTLMTLRLPLVPHDVDAAMGRDSRSASA